MKIKTNVWRLRAREKQFILVIVDLFAAYVALALALYLWSLRDAWSLTFWRERVAGWYYFVPLIWLLLLLNLYDPHQASNMKVIIRGILQAALLGLILYAVVYLLVAGNQARIGVGFFLALACILTLICRLVYARIFTSPAMQRRILILGAAKLGETLLDAYQSLKPAPFQLLGFVDDDANLTGTELRGYPILGTSKDLNRIVEQQAVSDLVIAVGGEMYGETFQAVLDVQQDGMEVTPMAELYEELLGRVPVQHLDSEWLIRSFVIDARPPVFYEVVKRAIDILGAMVGLTLFLILLPFLAMGTLIDSGLPIFYHQVRAGRNGRVFRVAKIRTMRQDANKDGMKPTIQADTRITRFGSFLRRTHLDESPQFWNVLRGEMSLVGPRPELPEWVAEFEKQIPFYRARLMVKPGISGWAQVNYAYFVTVEEMIVKLEYDLYYIKYSNLLMDLSILLRTIWQVFGLRGR